MDWLKPGMKVVIKKVGYAVLLYECKTPTGYWGVLVKPLNNNVDHIITRVPASDIEPYLNHCWNSGCTGKIDSRKHETHEICHWVICPECGSCRDGGCNDDHIRIQVK